MAKDKPSSTTQKPSPPFLTCENDDRKQWLSNTHRFFRALGTFGPNLPQSSLNKVSYFDLIRGILKLNHIERGRITCFVNVKPGVSNWYGSFHGGAVASVAESVAAACARTVVAEDKELFLGELANSYLSSAPVNAELEVEAVVVRHGRNVTITSVEFRLKGTKKLLYIARVTFYIMPIAPNELSKL